MDYVLLWGRKVGYDMVMQSMMCYDCCDMTCCTVVHHYYYYHYHYILII